MSIRSLAARGLSFAHLASLSTKAAKAEDDEEKKDARAEGDGDDEEKKDRDDGDAKADDGDDDKKDDDQKSSKAKSKAESDDDEDAEEGDEDKEKAEDDDDGDEEMRGKSAVARARLREQARCAAIFASKAAARNPVLAANLAFKTRMTRSEAIATLEGTPAPASAAHVSRSARNPNLGIDGGAKPSRQQALAARWDENLKAANPSRR